VYDEFRAHDPYANRCGSAGIEYMSAAALSYRKPSMPAYPGLMPDRNTCERHVGRLLEIRIGAGYRNAGEVDTIFSEIVAQSARFPSPQRLVIVTDWRKCTVMDEDAASKLAVGIRGTNARVERSGALLPLGSSVAMLQFQRLLRESNHPDRRGFSDPRNLVAWLSEVLASDEITRLHEFVG